MYSRTRRTLGAALALLSLASHSQTLPPWIGGQRDALKPYFRKLHLEGERNAVLNFNELGIAAFYLKDYAIAERALDESLQRIDTFVVGDENANRAKSTFSEERVKDFKGEPYERAMAYYYRGLLFIRAKDYQNARAAFLNAALQDTFSGTEKYSGDFGMMTYLAAWSSSCDGDPVRAKELMEAAVKEDPSLTSLGPPKKVLVLLETGRGPEKVGQGKHKELLTFSDSALPDARIDKVNITAANDRTKVLSSATAMPIGNIFFQASTRGGRPIQGILDGKAEFKDTAGTVRDVASAVGNQAVLQSLASGDSRMANFGLASTFIGLIATVAEAAATPAADTRGWSSLPRTILASGLEPGDLAGEVQVWADLDAGTRQQGTRVLAQHKDCSLLWGSTHSPVKAAGQLRDDIYADRSREAKDSVMRARINELFQGEVK